MSRKTAGEFASLPCDTLLHVHTAEPLSAAEWKQIELLRAATPAQRAALALSLTTQTLGLARRAIRQANPGADPDELRVRYVAAVYGQELATKLQAYLARKRDERPA